MPVPGKTPLVVFAFSRADRLELAVRTLARCARFDECSVTIVCDGPRNEADLPGVEATRRVAHSWIERVGGTVVEEPSNLGFARILPRHITRLVNEHGRIIVLEDDLYVSPDFLDFMLRGLERYAESDSVYQIGGFMYPIRELPPRTALLLPYTTSWGWATWKRAWDRYDVSMPGWEDVLADPLQRSKLDLENSYPFSRMLERHAAGTDLTWDIQWLYAVFRAGGLALYPPRSLVWNGGFWGPGTHSSLVNHSPEPRAAFDRPRLLAQIALPAELSVNRTSYARIQRYLRRVTRIEGHTPLTRLLYGPYRKYVRYIRAPRTPSQ